MKAISGILALFITAPIWFYMLYKILEAINASELVWFLYWIYVPAVLLVNILVKIAEAEK